MICKRYDIDNWFLIRMHTADHFQRFVHHFAPAVDFDLVLDCFGDLADLAFERVCAQQWAKVSRHGIDGHAVVVISHMSHTNVG